ncbi:hypothetical protein L289_3821 [Acinetobacter gerneri DSM 14967 = CIP 107464 = MTCC 9824]|nr:hypothetical protein L289_3821 [Acinetobacter gerneri DSM 14967 = CIP 107464 = MTCC 9824]
MTGCFLCCFNLFQFKVFDDLGLNAQNTDILHKQFAFNPNVY